MHYQEPIPEEDKFVIDRWLHSSCKHLEDMKIEIEETKEERKKKDMIARIANSFLYYK